MTQANPYTRTTGFADDERNNAGGRSTVRTAQVDAELDAIAVPLNLTIKNLALLQRDDTVMRDGVVPVSALGSDTLKLLTTGSAVVRGAWLTATAYAIKDLVTQSGNTYICAVAHTAGVFATDLAAVKWILFQIGANPTAGSIPFSPTVNTTSTNVQAAIVEVDSDLRAVVTAQSATDNAAMTAAVALVRSDLADPTDATHGANEVAYNPLKVYTTGVGAELRKGRNVRIYGTLANDGITDDSTTLLAAAASGPGVIDARGLTCRINSTITLGAGQVWLLEGATFNNALSNFTFFKCLTINNWAMLGPFTCVGGGSTIGTAKGLHIEDCSEWYVDRPIMSSIQGWGIYLAPGSSTTSRSRHGTINHPRYDSCYIGQEDLAGTGIEYVQTFGIHATRCTLSGVKTAAGNMKFTGGVVVDNIGNGIMVGAGSNHAHGSFNGLSINHNGGYGIRFDTVLNGELVNDCHIYENPIYINGSVGIIFSGGMLDASVVCDKDANSRPTIFRGMFCPGDYSSVTISGSGVDMLHFDLCHGLGAVNSSRTINDPSLVYVNARRPAGTNQALTSTVAARLIFPTEVFDRRNAHDATTGITTIPVDEWGMYRVSVSAVVSGTALNQTASFLEVRVNTVSKRLCASSITSTTRLTFHLDEELYLTPTDVVEVWINVTGTSPVFGDATYDSALSIEKKA